jgi:flagellar biosynthetic protein FlhB
MMMDVPGADVVIVNPTHFAVALTWGRKSGQVPDLCCERHRRGRGPDQDRRAEHGVPVFSDPPTARTLHATLDIGDPIAPDHYRAVAAAIRFADAIRIRAKRPGAPTRREGHR